jgi:hypothetical protein
MMEALKMQGHNHHSMKDIKRILLTYQRIKSVGDKFTIADANEINEYLTTSRAPKAGSFNDC